MISLQNVSKTYQFEGRAKVVADDISVVFPSRKSVALLGRNGTGKSSLLKMIAGTLLPSSGRIEAIGSVSWPVGFAGSFHPDLTGAQNAKFIARVYGVDTRELSDFVEDFAELGHHFRQPFRTYSAGMRSRLAFGVSMAIPFDTYLVDEVTSVGDAAFRAKSTAVFKARMKQAGAIVVTHSIGMVRELCTEAAVMENGRLTYYTDLNAAIDHHHRNLGV